MPRQKPSSSGVFANPCSTAATDHHSTATAYPIRVPYRSTNFPMIRNPIM